MQDLEKADMFINNQVVDTEYYVLFKETRMDALQEKLRSMINGFASCSLLATPVTDDDLRQQLKLSLILGEFAYKT